MSGVRIKPYKDKQNRDENIMKPTIIYLLLAITICFSTHLLAITCPRAVICNTKSIESCYAVDSCFPICDSSHKTHCWNAIKLKYGELSRTNEYDRPPLNNMCYYLNDCGLYSVILDYQGERAFKWSI